MRRVARLLAVQRGPLAAMLALGLAYVALSVAVPRLLGLATDVVASAVFDNHPLDTGALARLLAGAAAGSLLASLCAVGQGRLTTTIVQRVGVDLRTRAHEALARLPVREIDRRPRGDLLSRVGTDVDTLVQSLQLTLNQFVWSALTLVGVLAMMLVISPVLAAVALVTIPLSTVVAGWVGRRARPLFAAQQAALGAVSAYAEEAYTGRDVVRAFDREDTAAREFAVPNDALYEAGRRAQFVSGLIGPAILFLDNLTYVLLAVVGALRVASGASTLGDVQALIHYARQLGQPVSEVASTANLVQSGLAAARRVFELLDTPSIAVATRRAPLGRGAVTFDRVSYSYEPGVPVLSDVSFTVHPGQTLALVGATGAGKTTVTQLLLRFLDVDSGQITVDGEDIATLDPVAVRAVVAVVPQEPWLYTGTVAANIAYGVPGATREAIVAAAHAVHLDPFVRTLPHGYDTVVRDEFSVGQRQLVTIARAYLVDPAILVLDEATSALDPRTEHLVRAATRTLRQGRTSIVIAHRLATVREADLVVVLDRGRVVEAGSPEHLRTSAGPYARLHAASL